TYAVGPGAQRSRTPDLELWCADRSRITEVHLRSNAFCSSGGTCVTTRGSLRKLVRELGPNASVQTRTECMTGGGGCSAVVASYGRNQVALRSENCPTFMTLRGIGPGCVAAEVLIYRQP